ncbi:MAG UNVERIFIED_CONTAM: hypothetical protein LVR29_12100 [Microcystis novacekii LVE1205-3]
MGDQETWYDPNPDVPGKIYAPYGAFLEQIEEFDGEFFGIIPRESVAMDPQAAFTLGNHLASFRICWTKSPKITQQSDGSFYRLHDSRLCPIKLFSSSH